TNTQEAPAVVDVVLQRSLLCRVQGGTFGGEENDAAVLGEVLCGEVARVTGGRDREAVLCSEGLDRRHGLLDRIVLLIRVPVEHQDAHLTGGGSRFLVRGGHGWRVDAAGRIRHGWGG